MSVLARVQLNADTDSPVLILNDPDALLWRIDALQLILEDLDVLYLRAYELAYGVAAPSTDQAPEIVPIVTVRGRPHLLLLGARTGSLTLELVQEFAPFVAQAGGGIGALALLGKMLRALPNEVERWLTLPDRVRANRRALQRDEAEERARIAEAEARIRRIHAAIPELEIAVIADGHNVLDDGGLEM